MKLFGITFVPGEVLEASKLNLLAKKMAEAVDDVSEEIEAAIEDIPEANTANKGFLPKVTTGVMYAGSASMPVPVWNGTRTVWTSLSVASTTDNGIMTKEQVHTLDVHGAQITALMNKAEISVSLSTNVVEVGQITNVTINGNLTSSNGMNADSMSIYENTTTGSSLKTTANTNSISFARSVSLSSVGSQTYIVTATIAGGTISKSADIYARYATYCGFGATASAVNGVGKRVVTSAVGTYTGTASANGVKYYILVPTGTTAPTSFTMNATPFVMNNKGTQTINSVSYTVLESGSTFNSGGNVNIVAS